MTRTKRMIGNMANNIVIGIQPGTEIPYKVELKDECKRVTFVEVCSIDKLSDEIVENVLGNWHCLAAGDAYGYAGQSKQDSGLGAAEIRAAIGLSAAALDTKPLVHGYQWKASYQYASFSITHSKLTPENCVVLGPDFRLELRNKYAAEAMLEFWQGNFKQAEEMRTAYLEQLPKKP
jgi:hypothetical protein